MIYLRNLDPRRVACVPMAPGWTRLILPQAATAVPAAVLHVPAVQRALHAERLAVVTEITASADARAAAVLRRDMALALAQAEQLEFDRYRRCHRVARRVPSLPGGPGHHAGKWPDAKNTRFETQWKTGAPLAELAAEFGISKSSVVHKAARLGLAARRGGRVGGMHNGWPVQRVEQLQTLWLSGTPLRQIAAELGVREGAITTKLWRLKLPPRRWAA